MSLSDLSFAISTGRSRLETRWQAKTVSWAALTGYLRKVQRTRETVAEYAAMTKPERAALKDVGGFVGGRLGTPERKASSVLARSLVTLDIDYAQDDTLGIVRDMLAGTAWFAYTTHSHTPQSQRWRLVVPLSREVSPDEYVPIARRVADDIGMDLFDDSTYEPSRLMYWPSASADGDFRTEEGDGEVLDADATLATYRDWRDVTTYPVSKRVQVITRKGGSKQADPTTKRGLIGAFCRTYGIAEAIETYLPDKYSPVSGTSDRYTYIDGSTAAGLVVYEDKWAFSHHGTDPCCGKLCNAFDLVRIHLFGEEDKEAAQDTPVNRLPSFAKMEQLLLKDKAVAARLNKERTEEIFRELGEAIGDDDPAADPSDDKSWRNLLQKDERGKHILATPYNFELICRNDPGLKDTVSYDSFLDRAFLLRDLPWRKITSDKACWGNGDDNGLISYVSRYYQLTGKTALLDSHDLVMQQTAHHPVRDYLSALEWDGTPRLDTLLVDYLGAEDNPLTRAMTRKHFTAAVARIFEPGCKYDYILTFTGVEGIGKSTLIRALGQSWFDDSFSSADVGTKEAMEQLRGRWLIEMGELTSYRKATVESFKAFVTRQEDNYRPAYGRKVENYPRQCVFFATTNEEYFLKGNTGNRRFWAVRVGILPKTKDVFQLAGDQYEIDQIWAEAVTRYHQHEMLCLDAAMEMEAKARQQEHNELTDDGRTGIIAAYLQRQVPTNWYSLTKDQRRAFFTSAANPSLDEHLMTRRSFCPLEVMEECLGEKPDYYKARDIAQILRNLGLTGPVWTRSVETSEGKKSDPIYGPQKRFLIIESEPEKDDFGGATHPQPV